ncbi:mucin-5AC-like isoform X2 [Aphidius gifuensis]|uniref:mucin-5AC-like isoform X2 n=1 Tax=Aphidius gifuensis TaxID=684658 RepID=UPI001CDD2859|nr:mucin-5AC-like isoform X2 [Aphidius gifuensis]
MWLKSALLFCAIAFALAKDEKIINQSKLGHEYVNIRSTSEKPRAVAIQDFVTSHKIPEGIETPHDDDSDESIEPKKLQRIEKFEKKINDLSNVEQSLDDYSHKLNKHIKRQAQVELENFSDAGVIKEEGIRKIDAYRAQENREKVDVIPGVQVSSEYATTMHPILTTERQLSSSFDFVPVNIIREDTKDSWTPYANKNFDDSDVSLIPAGSNTRTQIKKGPNGKDYEYEYVYYYYDEEDVPKTGGSVNNQEGLRTTSSSSSSKRGHKDDSRSKYSSVERSTTAEPVNNEIITNKHGNRGRHLDETTEDENSEDRLPNSTRFPARSRSNHNTGTTEPTRPRGNRPRAGLDLVDSSSFRTHQEGPEFPQSLPKGPVRFLGVTPNENNEEKTSKTRGRPLKNQEPAPVIEAVDDMIIMPALKKGHPTDESSSEVESNRGQPIRSRIEGELTTSISPLSNKNNDEKQISTQSTNNYETSSDLTTEEIPTTEYPSAMDKVALDLYAFLQQGQSNLVDSVTNIDDTNESTTNNENESTTNLSTIIPDSGNPTTIESTSTNEVPTIPPSTTTTTTTTTTSTTTTTAATVAGLPGRGKFRRPTPASVSGGTRNRFKNPVSTTSSSVTESSSSTSSSSSGVSRPSFNKLNINRRRGRPTTAATSTSDDTQDSDNQNGSTETSLQHETTATTTKSSVRPKIGGIGARPSRPPSGKINIRRPGQLTTTSTTTAPITASSDATEGSVEEPAGEGTEEETHEAPAETSPPTRSTTQNPLNKLRNKNRIQVQPKTTTRSSVTSSPRRSPLLPRRKVSTEAPVSESTNEELSTDVNEIVTENVQITESPLSETSSAASNKHEEARGLNSLLAPRRRIPPRRQLIAQN